MSSEATEQQTFDQVWQTLDVGEQLLSLPPHETIRASTSRHFETVPLDTLPKLPWGEDLEPGEPLGEGGQGLVILAEQRSLRRKVALKALKPERSSPLAIESFVQEAVFTGSLEHPNIVPVYALGRDPQGMPIFTMKHVEGVCWRDLIYDSDHPAWAQVSGDRLVWHLEVLLRVADAVRYAHSHKVLHRDIKPENVMVGAYGEVYLMDWGIALHLGEESAVAPGELCGTPAYMAPEMTLMKRAGITLRTDIYLLGACLHEVLAGTVRHQGGSLYATLAMAFTSHPASYDPTVPEDLAAISNRACHADAAQRYHDVEGFQRALAGFLEHRHSLRLGEAAQARLLMLLEALSEGESEATVQDHFSACRFGFQQALEAWPENGAAERGLQRALGAMIHHEIKLRHARAARHLLGLLPQPDPELEAAITALEAALDQEASELSLLRRERKGRDLLISIHERGLSALIIGLGWSLVCLFVIVLEHFGLYKPDHAGHLLAVSSIFIIEAAVIAVGRKRLLQTPINRQVMLSSIMWVGVAVLQAAVAPLLGMSVQAALVGDMLLAALAMLVMAVLVEWRLVFAGLVCVPAIFASALWPTYILEIIAVLMLAGHLMVYVAWKAMFQRRKTADEAPPSLVT